jgi:hypothetical protein
VNKGGFKEGRKNGRMISNRGGKPGLKGLRRTMSGILIDRRCRLCRGAVGITWKQLEPATSRAWSASKRKAGFWAWPPPNGKQRAKLERLRPGRLHMQLAQQTTTPFWPGFLLGDGLPPVMLYCHGVCRPEKTGTSAGMPGWTLQAITHTTCVADGQRPDTNSCCTNLQSRAPHRPALRRFWRRAVGPRCCV